MRTIALLLALLPLTREARAHRLDEYLQATLITITQGRIELDLNLTPGVAVLPLVLFAIDTNKDGFISANEQSAYALRLVSDLELEVDRERLPLKVVKSEFPQVADMREGLGRIRIEVAADLASRRTADHRLRFQNRHQPGISAWLVNCIAPHSDTFIITRQERDYLQSKIQVDYSFPPNSYFSTARAALSGIPLWLDAAGLFLLVRVALLSYRRSAGAVSPHSHT
jgi:hypothetical protein